MKGVFFINFIFKLLFIHFIKNWSNWFLTFGLPLILWYIMSAVSMISVNNDGPNVALPGLLLSCATNVGIIALSINLSDLKNSVIIKRLQVSSVGYWSFLLWFVLLYFLVSIISMIWIGLWAVLVFHQYLHAAWTNWVMVLGAIVCAAIIACLIGSSIALLTSQFRTTICLALTIYLLFNLLSGLYMTMTFIMTNELLWDISYALVFTYVMNLMNEGWFYFNNDYVQNYLGNYTSVEYWWINLIVIMTVMILLFILGIRFVKRHLA